MVENKKRIIHTFVKEIGVFHDTIEIYYKINLNISNNDNSIDYKGILSKTTFTADKVVEMAGDGSYAQSWFQFHYQIIEKIHKIYWVMPSQFGWHPPLFFYEIR